MIEVFNIRIAKVFREKEGVPSQPMSFVILENKEELEAMRQSLIKILGGKAQSLFGTEEIEIDISFKEI
jgi:hypothetical protein